MPRWNDVSKTTLYYNKVLESNNQKLCIIERKPKQFVLFSNGVLLKGQVADRLFIRRIKIQTYIDNFDIIYGNNNAASSALLTQIKQNGRRKGGIACMAAHKKRLIEARRKTPPWNKGMKSQYSTSRKGQSKESNLYLAKLSEDRKGAGNPRFGKITSEETRKLISFSMLKLIKDKLFTPQIKNCRTHWQVKVDGQAYRSTWEAAYHFLNPTESYEFIRIPYTKESGKLGIYIVDFYNANSRILTEIKPISHLAKFDYKEKAAREWCEKNTCVFRIISEDYFKNKSNLDAIFESCLPEIVKTRIRNIRCA